MRQLAAVIVETRSYPDLVEVIRDHHLKYLPPNTQLIIFHSSENYETLKSAFPNAGFSDISGLNALSDYNYLLTRPEFWEMLKDFEGVLIFQYDSRLLRIGIEAFFGCDYVGAPWKWAEPEYIGGNGGLSLRNPRIMQEICTRVPWDRQTNEDHWFCLKMKELGVGNIAPRELADKFSCETISVMGTLGYHSIRKWLPEVVCAEIEQQYDNLAPNP